MSINLYSDYGYLINYVTDDASSEVSLQRRKNPYINKSNTDKLHLVIEGERLDTISYKYYGNSKYWWVLADSNDISDNMINPFVLTSGSTLIIPSLDNFLSQ